MDNSVFRDVVTDINSMADHYRLSDQLRAALLKALIEELEGSTLIDFNIVDIDVKQLDISDLKIPWEFPPEMP